MSFTYLNFFIFLVLYAFIVFLLIKFLRKRELFKSCILISMLVSWSMFFLDIRYPYSYRTPPIQWFILFGPLILIVILVAMMIIFKMYSFKYKISCFMISLLSYVVSYFMMLTIIARIS
jgi:hypothetical protein